MSKKGVFIFEVSQQNFDDVVIQNSFKLPVLVEFMGVWSGPCIQMSDDLATLAKEFAGEFIFAKIDIDEQSELAEKYAIKNVPSLNVFVKGEIVQNSEGLLGQTELRAVLKSVGVYSQVDEMRQQAREKHMAGDTLVAIQLLTKAMHQAPSDINVAMDMVQIFIDLNELDQAEGLYNQLPPSTKDTEMGKSLSGQLAFLTLAAKTQGKTELQQLLMARPDECDLHFDLSICLIAERSYEQAVDHLIHIIKIDENYKQNAAQEMIINVANMLADNNPALSSELRGKLSANLN